MIAVVDSGRGNLLSVCNALTWLGAEPVICSEPEAIESAERLVLPGVGAFRDGMEILRTRGFVEALDRFRQSGRPVLGVCLGMQFLADLSHEHGLTEGLGWIPGEVRRLETSLRVPHVGWNAVHAQGAADLFAGIPDGCDFYFTHSFHVQTEDPADVAATCEYGTTVTAALQRGNVAATQFHPEKSQDHGLAVLENFLRWAP